MSKDQESNHFLEAMVAEKEQLKRRLEAACVQRNAVFEENKSLRALLAAKTIENKELKSELEGRMDEAHEAITQLETEVSCLKLKLSLG